MRTILLAAALALATGCSAETGTYINALNGQVCEPNSSYKPRKQKAPASNDKCQGTSNGDNCDDLSSGKIDCIGDGNSGQGDDKKHNCQFPQPGCDEDGCCDDDIVVTPPGDGTEEPPDEGTTPPGDGTTPPGDGTEDPPDDGTEPPPSEPEDTDGPIFL